MLWFNFSKETYSINYLPLDKYFIYSRNESLDTESNLNKRMLDLMKRSAFTIYFMDRKYLISAGYIIEFGDESNRRQELLYYIIIWVLIIILK